MQILDENFHHEGFRAFAAVNCDVTCFDWNTGGLLFKMQNGVTNGSRISIMQVRALKEAKNDTLIASLGFVYETESCDSQSFGETLQCL